MYQPKLKRIVRFFVLLAIIGLTLLPVSTAKAVDSKGPELPEQCVSIEVPEGNKLKTHSYARGVQIYRWNGTAWDFVAPMALLFAEEGFHGEVGIHYVGPTWKSKSGSRVVAQRVPGTGCTPDPKAIPWLLLEATATSAHGIFKNITFIQRVNTVGGLVPTEPGLSIGELKEVPYTAEYYFYRAH